MQRLVHTIVIAALVPTLAVAQRQESPMRTVKVALVKMPYTGARNVPDLSRAPDYLEEGGIVRTLQQMGALLKETATVRLTPEEAAAYGEWHRMSLANAHLKKLVTTNAREGFLTVGLLGNCTSLLGVLAGLQNSGPVGNPLRVGLIFIDAHGDFNTPETTLSGMLGGMPVAISAGLALHSLRLKSGLNPVVPTDHIVMAAVRELDPLEKELVDRSRVEMISVADIREQSSAIDHQLQRLSEVTDAIYVHVDMDVLDPNEVPGHPLRVADGPTSTELAATLTKMFRYEKVVALGIASTPFGERDLGGTAREAAYRLIRGAVAGVQQR